MEEFDVKTLAHLKNEVTFWRGECERWSKDRRPMRSACCLWLASINNTAVSIFENLFNKDG